MQIETSAKANEKKKLFGNFVKHAIKRSLASMNKGVGLDFIKHHSLLKHT